ncbi:uncharacterized protein [Spinacia oleracea]|uniref:Uncharacterized protein n=1 Tax=Spinacia oleracea TaxID=3562 RepID=A0ABM3QHH6_SPIOL|nr:uncharacterized protein LOC130459461 [Spinacia oleracea]XP_056682812.1 uncharacterized protein LOC130459461 [Spinacia oleracea]
MSEIEIQAQSVENPEADYEKLVLELDSKAEVVLSTTTANFGKSPRLHIIDTHFWSGRAISGFPALHKHFYAVPKQQGTLPQGIKWGLVYADGDETTARKWVAAFDTTAGKAYAEAGPIGPVDWNVVEVKLDASESKSIYTDPIMGGITTAEINGLTAKAIFSG